MLKRLHLRNFTVFADAEFEFGEGINVLVGANGTGKTHVLKAGYILSQRLHKSAERSHVGGDRNDNYIELQYLLYLINKSEKVFRLNDLGTESIIRRGISQNTESSMAGELLFAEHVVNRWLRFGQTYHETPDNIIEPIIKGESVIVDPIFIPAKEVLTMGWLLSLYSRREIPIDETYPDLLRLLSGPPLRQPEPAHIVEKLAQLIGGKVEEEGGHFYLTAENQPRLEMNLVAEGMRKFATLYKLLANGTLTPETTLFWDEPEANLNPALLKDMASILTDLAQAGFQIILATHSLFLMRELHILAQQKKKPVRYFGLYAGEDGAVQVERQDDLMQLQHLVALDAELAQTFDFEAALDDDYAGDS